MKRKLKPNVVVKRKKLKCGHAEEWLNLLGQCTICVKPKPAPVEKVLKFKKPVHPDLPQHRVERHCNEKPSVLKIAFGVLVNCLKVDDKGYYFLKTEGKWHSANLHQVMRATNAVLKNTPGATQIDVNPNWKV